MNKMSHCTSLHVTAPPLRGSRDVTARYCPSLPVTVPQSWEAVEMSLYTCYAYHCTPVLGGCRDVTA